MYYVSIFVLKKKKKIQHLHSRYIQAICSNSFYDPEFRVYLHITRTHANIYFCGRFGIWKTSENMEYRRKTIFFSHADTKMYDGKTIWMECYYFFSASFSLRERNSRTLFRLCLSAFSFWQTR